MATLPQDLEQSAELTGFDRQRELAKLLIAKGLTQPQGQMIGDRYIAPSPTQNMAGLAQILSGRNLQDSADSDQMALAKSLRERKVADLSAIQEALTPVEASPEIAQAGPMPNGGSIPVTPAVAARAPDYAKALRIASGSQDPSIQAWANKQALPEDYSLKEGEQRFKGGVNGGAGVVVNSGGVATSADIKTARDALGLPRDPATWTPQQRSAAQQWIMQDSKNKGTHITNISGSTETQYGKDVAGAIAKSDMTLRDNAMLAGQKVMRAEEQAKLLNNPNLYSGVGANAVLDVNKLGAAMGMKGAVKRADVMQAVMTNTAATTLESIHASGLGSGQGFTDKDLKFLQDAKGGNITMTRGNLQRLNDIAARAAIADATKWNTRLEQIPSSTTSTLGIKPVDVPKWSGGGYTPIAETPKAPLPGQAPAAAPVASAPVKLNPQNADAEYAALPKGATFVAPDGSVRTKQ